MIRRAIASWIMGSLLIFGTVAADDPKPDEPEPPVRLKKKEKPNTTVPEKKPDTPKDNDKEKPKEDPKEKDKLKRPEQDAPEPDVDEKETLARINKNMRASEDRLAKKDASDGTRQIQRDILKDIDSLLEQKKKQQQSSQQQNQQNQQNKRSQRNQLSKGSRSSQNQSGNSQSTADGSNPSGSGNQGGGGNTNAKKEDNKMADLFKDVWGHLPASLRMEMDTYSREKFMARYKELLEQYYATIAEKGRRKGE